MAFEYKVYSTVCDKNFNEIDSKSVQIMIVVTWFIPFSCFQNFIIWVKNLTVSCESMTSEKDRGHIF